MANEIVNYTDANGYGVAVSAITPLPVTNAGSGATAQQVQGTAADGAAAVGNPVQTGGVDGSGNAQALAVDTSGRTLVVGAAAAGAAISGSPVLTGGSDGTNARALAVDTSGRVTMVGAAADGAAASGNPVLVSGIDGSNNAQTIATDTSGRVAMVGAAADGAAAAGNPVLVAGMDGSNNAQSIATDTSGNQIAVGNVASAATDSGNPVKAGGKYNSTLPTFTDGQRGDIQISAKGKLLSNIAALAVPADGLTNAASIIYDNADAGRPLQILPMAWNTAATAASSASTWDRVRGDVNGLVSQLHAMTGSRWSYAAATGGITNTTTAVTITASAGGSLRNYVTGVQLSADALGAATEVAIRDGAGGTVLLRVKVGTAGIVGVQNLTFDSPLKGSAATLLEVVTLTATVTGGVYVNVQGFTGV